jgi:UDP-N-acetyl-D-mannosaminuronic acid transferase (WecB/TagA/CpsF family)
VALLSTFVDSTPESFVAALVAKEREMAGRGEPVRVTWLNHYSIQIALSNAGPAWEQMDVCGIDGQFLKWLLRHPARTSADLIVPILLRCDESIKSVLAIGGRGDRAAPLEQALSECAGRPVIVHSIDGFEGLLRGPALQRLVEDLRPDLLLVGLGAGLQEQVLVEAAQGMAGGYALTCGGYLDQVLVPGYYPAWAYPLRLNWLVRLARDPRRLWRRYTTEALAALVRAAGWRRTMGTIPGVLAHARMCSAEGLGS